MPGLAFAAVTTSARVLYGESAPTTITSGALATRLTGVRSFARVVGQLGVERRVDREVAGLAQHQRVAVGRRLGRGVHAEVAAGARLVVDDEVPAGAGPPCW